MNETKLIKKISDMLHARADRVAGGTLAEDNPLEFVLRGESVSARIYRRYNASLVLALDVFVDDVDESADVFRWVATRSGVMPFATIRVDRPLVRGSAPAAVKISHSLLADDVSDRQLDEVLDAMTYMSRRTRTRLHEYVANLVDRTEPIDRSSSNEGASALDPVVGPEIDTAMSSAQQFLDEEDAGEGIEGDGDDMPFDSAGVTTPAKDRSHDAILRELEEMVGLEPVKEEINRVIAAQRLADLRRRRGLPNQDMSPHLVFVGNPGTGKTTVARLIGELYRSLGMLPSGHLVEADRSTLVAAYMGQTAIKTRQVCEKALGGVLFIDEAYSLVGERDQYGEECVNTLLQFMENHRGEFAVVVAGYPAEMYGFIDSNPGLRARFDLFLEFPDYSSTELEQIFTGIAEKNDYVLAPDALAKVRSFIAAWPRWRGFGNGREVRKLFGDIARRHAELLFAAGDGKKVSTEALRTITADAVPDSPVYQQPVTGVRYGDGGYL